MKTEKVKWLIMRVLLQGALTFICALPTILFFVIKGLLAPEGFWQNFVMYGLGFYMGLGIQIFLLIVFISGTLALWTEE